MSTVRDIRTSRTLIAFVVALLMVLPSVAFAAPGGVSPHARGTTDVIVTFAPGTDPVSQAATVGRMGGSVRHVYQHVFPGLAAQVPVHALDGLRRNPNVQALEIDGVVRTASAGVQQNPTWGLDRIDQATLPLDRSYTFVTSATGVTAYIVDTGILATHTDFGGRVTSGFTSIADGRGTNDCNGHGTHVAGTVGGATYGVAKAVTLVPVRVLDCNGSGSWSGVLAGLDWIARNHPAGAPGVVNMSLGGGASTSIDAAVANLAANNLVVVVAAGNSATDACTTSPARAAEALPVAATTSTDARASFSNFGPCVDLFAPRASITSTWVGSVSATRTISGTSMAAPHVAGAAALILATNTELPASAVVDTITRDATAGVVTDVRAGSPNLLLRTTSTPSEPIVAITPDVGAIAMRLSAGRWTSGTATISLINQDKPSDGVGQVTVTGRFVLNGTPQASVTGVATADGTVSFSSPTFRVQQATLGFCVTSLSGSRVTDVTFDPLRCDTDVAGPEVPDTPSEPGVPSNPCMLKWVEEFGFLTVPTLALVANPSFIALTLSARSVCSGAADTTADVKPERSPR